MMKNLAINYTIVRRYLPPIFLLLLAGCGDDEFIVTSGINDFACMTYHPTCIDEATFILKNGSTATNITNISIVENCTSGWSAGSDTNIAPGGKATIDVDADTRYDIRVMWADNRCDIRRNRKLRAGEEEDITMKYSLAVCTC